MNIPKGACFREKNQFTISMEQYTSHYERQDELLYNVVDGKANIISCHEDVEGQFVIPEKINGYDVYSIAEETFIDCDLIETIVIPGCVKEISSQAFKGLSNFKISSNSFSIKEYCSSAGLSFKRLYTSGDANGDGSIDALDFIKAKNQAANKQEWTISTDINEDDSIDSLDLVGIKRKVLKVD